ncbi:putative leucine-rich repeat receptor-like protein kinase [Glycine max]|nr:putative leucine-rich repeat receptor-like protein kinase [Glycine max]
MKKVEAFFVVLLWVGIVLFLFGGSRAAACGGVVEGLMILITLVYTHISILNVHSKFEYFRRLTGLDIKGELSEDIGLLSELEMLDLSNNKGLTGSLPHSIGNLTKLSNL